MVKNIFLKEELTITTENGLEKREFFEDTLKEGVELINQLEKGNKEAITKFISIVSILDNEKESILNTESNERKDLVKLLNVYLTGFDALKKRKYRFNLKLKKCEKSLFKLKKKLE